MTSPPSAEASPLRSTLRHELDVVTAIARAAAAKILDVRNEALQSPEYKPNDAGPVTLADLAADKLIRDQLHAAFPNDLVITEETWEPKSTIENATRAWIVDPLDGTADFVKGGDDYAVMIGLCIDGIPRVGVVCQPATMIVWRGISADDNGGAHQSVCERLMPDGTVVDLRVDTRPMPSPARFALSRNHKSPLADFITENLGGVIVRKGSVGLKIALILDDEADIYLSGSVRIKVWDTAGPAALLAAAGGPLITSLAGDALAWSGEAAHREGIRAVVPAANELFGDAFATIVSRYRRARAGVASDDDD